jgi:drug/metabolite transporter (DMT)-like permease
VTQNSRGMAWMIVATMLFVALDTTGKYLTQLYPVQQVIWARFTFHFIFALTLALALRDVPLRSKRPALQITRSLLMLAANGLFLFAVRSMPLVEVTSILFVGPLIVTALSVPLLGEHVGARRWTAVLVGFAGAMIIIQPGSDALTSVAVLPLLGAFSFALYQVATRVLNHVDAPLTTLVYTAVGGTVISSIAVPWYWSAPDALGWGLFATVGVLGALGQLALIKAIRAAPLPVVAPFNYLTLVWATIAGFLVFGDLPGPSTLVGAIVIVGSGLYVVHREQVRKEE